MMTTGNGPTEKQMQPSVSSNSPIESPPWSDAVRSSLAVSEALADALAWQDQKWGQLTAPEMETDGVKLTCPSMCSAL
jgi:hypothetical protein